MTRAGALAVAALLLTPLHAATPPDFSGWWTSAVPPVEDWLANPPPLNAAALAARQKRVESDVPEPYALRYCGVPQFSGYSGGFEGGLEFLVTPGRITLASEDGRLRRIYVDGRAVPKDMEPSNNGLSVGHWEGQTLVVVTTHLDPDIAFPAGMGLIGHGARITERMELKGPDTLVFEIETEAPEVLTKPDRRTRTYRRYQVPVAQEITFCASRLDRSVDKATGRQQFDMTPPADLPPPPPAPK